MSKVWFITGTSRGFGRVWAEAALKRGDKVAATARNIDTLKELVDKYGDSILPIALDVTDKKADIAAVEKAHDKFGRIDVLINNAGYGHFGAVEEVTEEEARAQMETNFFGALWLTQAVLPIMRAQKSGHIMQVSSIGGVAAFGSLGMYHASKWALEAFTESLSQEVSPFGIKATLIEPGGFATDWGGSSSKHSAPMSEYEPARAARNERWKHIKQGDPNATAAAILKAVDDENPPLRLLLGDYVVDMAKQVYAGRIETWEKWKDVSIAAHGN